jgi:hypothetical protein
MVLSESLPRVLTEALLAFGWAEEGTRCGTHVTDEGEARARCLIRAHRLWERYLLDEEGISLEAVHAEAHHGEHNTTPEELERPDARLGHAAWDPHGHVIPASGCRAPSSIGRPLSETGTPGSSLRIILGVAFNLDRLTQAVGSQGKHTLGAMMSFGCNVTGVQDCRIIENAKDRVVAIVTSPLVLCKGRFEVGLALIILFFGDRALLVTLVFLAIRVGAMLLATCTLNQLFFREEPSGFVGRTFIGALRSEG